MPIYEYLCDCGEEFEDSFSIKEDSSTTPCPKCGGAARKVPSLSAFHLKGSGWYKDGYVKGSKQGSKKECKSSGG